MRHPTHAVVRPAARHGLAFLLLLPLLSGCAILESPGGGFNLVSVDQEWSMGEELNTEIDKQMAVMDDPELDAFINGLGNRLLAATDGELARRPWTFHMVKDDSVNAFNIPGGHVYVHTGLVMALDDYAQLAGVVGHEIGHGLARHGTRQLTAQYGFSFALALALGEDPGQLEALVSQALAGGVLLKFGRDDEIQADRFGVHLTHGAGIDPRGVVDMLGVLASLRERQPSKVEKLLASHPDPERRMEVARERVSGLPARSGLVRQTGEFEAFRRRVARLSSGS